MTAYVPPGGASCGATGLSTAVTAVATETEAEADVRDIAVCCAVCRSHCSRRTNVHFAPQPGDGQQEHRNYNHHYHLLHLHLHLHLHHWQQTTTTMTTPRGCHAPWRGRRRVDMPNAMRLFWSWGNRCRKHHAARRVDRLIHALDQQFLLAWKDTRLIDLSRRGSHSATTAYAAA